jgi:ribonuclease P protein component
MANSVNLNRFAARVPGAELCNARVRTQRVSQSAPDFRRRLRPENSPNVLHEGKPVAVGAIASMQELNGSLEPGNRRVRFPRRARLLRHADFERVYKQGRRHFSGSMTVFYLQRAESQVARSKSSIAPGPRVGFTVGRALGGAVQRNRMKRRLREAVRLTRPVKGLSVDVVINPKKSLLTTNFAIVRNEVNRAFVTIEQKLKAENSAAALPKRNSGHGTPEA